MAKQAKAAGARNPAAARSLKGRAMQALKRRKMYEQQRNMISATGFKLEATSFAIENAKETHKTVQAMKSAHTVSCLVLLLLPERKVPTR